MDEPKKMPRGRPRKYPLDLINDIMREKGMTRRGANNQLLESYSFVKICDECSEDTQRFFLGGLIRAEALAGKPKLFCQRNYVMQELGRFPDDEIAGIANAIAENPLYRSWTQKEIVEFLKSIRLRAD